MLAKETTREPWGWFWMDQLAQDVAYTCRTLRKAPGFTAVAVLTLALGIGANTAMFSVIEAVLFRPLPFPDPDRVVAIGELDFRRSGRGATSVSWPNYFDWRARAHTFTGLSAYRDAAFTLVGSGPSQHIPGAVVSADFFSTLGVQPVLGRAFRQDEERAGSDVVVASDAFWRTQLGGAADVVGRMLALNGRSFTLVGVLPPGFRFPIAFPPPQLWTTAAEDARVENPADSPMTAERGAHFLRVVGRLRPGVDLAAVQADLDVVARALAKEYPADNTDRGVRVRPQLDALVGKAKRPLLVLLGAVGCVLLIACANLANLLFARGAARRREIALRAALGASRHRIARQLLTESLVLSAFGAACGLALASWSVRLLVHLSPMNLRGLDEVAIDAPVLVFALAIAVACAALFGMAPALGSARREFAGELTGARTTAGRSQRRLLGALVVAETTIGVVLLVAAGLLLRGFERLSHTHPGFDPEQVVTMRVNLPDSRYPYLKQIAFYDALLPDLQRLPGVQATAIVAPLPLGGSRYGISFELAGAERQSAADRLSADFALVSPGYFHAMRIPLRAGREFTLADSDAAPRVVVVNESFARQYFPGTDPIGKRMKPSLSTTERETPWREIVGLVSDVKQEALNESARAGYFVPFAQGLITTPHIVVRTAADPDTVVESVRKVIAARDPALAVHDVRSMADYLSTSMASPRFDTWLLALFAALGLVLTAVGLYGVLAYGVSQRTHEFGVRFALGPRPRDVLVMVLRGAIALAGFGLLLGIGAAAAAARVLSQALDFVEPADPAIFVGVAALLVAVAVAAAYVPARRAARVDPMITLRAE